MVGEVGLLVRVTERSPSGDRAQVWHRSRVVRSFFTGFGEESEWDQSYWRILSGVVACSDLPLNNIILTDCTWATVETGHLLRRTSLVQARD